MVSVPRPWARRGPTFRQEPRLAHRLQSAKTNTVCQIKSELSQPDPADERKCVVVCPPKDAGRNELGSLTGGRRRTKLQSPLMTKCQHRLMRASKRISAN